MGSAVVEVDIAHSVPDTLAEVASLGSFERRPSPKKEAVFGTEDGALRSDDFSRLGADVLVTPRAIIFYKNREAELFGNQSGMEMIEHLFEDEPKKYRVSEQSLRWPCAMP